MLSGYAQTPSKNKSQQEAYYQTKTEQPNGLSMPPRSTKRFPTINAIMTTKSLFFDRRRTKVKTYDFKRYCRQDRFGYFNNLESSQ